MTNEIKFRHINSTCNAISFGSAHIGWVDGWMDGGIAPLNHKRADLRIRIEDASVTAEQVRDAYNAMFAHNAGYRPKAIATKETN